MHIRIVLDARSYLLITCLFNEQNAIAFLTSYEPEDITEIQLKGQSTSVWGISPPSKQELINQLLGPTKARLEFHATFLRWEPLLGTEEKASQSLHTFTEIFDQIKNIKVVLK